VRHGLRRSRRVQLEFGRNRDELEPDAGRRYAEATTIKQEGSKAWHGPLCGADHPSMTWCRPRPSATSRSELTLLKEPQAYCPPTQPILIALPTLSCQSNSSRMCRDADDALFDEPLEPCRGRCQGTKAKLFGCRSGQGMWLWPCARVSCRVCVVAMSHAPCCLHAIRHRSLVFHRHCMFLGSMRTETLRYARNGATFCTV
jgi:hypothetical protein